MIKPLDVNLNTFKKLFRPARLKRLGLSAVKNLLPFIRYKYVFDPDPLKDLVPAGPERTQWQSEGDDPNFLLISQNHRFPLGWVFLNFTMKKERAGAARLYVDYGNGFIEENSISIPVSRKGTINFLVRFKKRVRALRWDPLEGPGLIALDNVIIYEISWMERIWRMLRRVIPAVSNKCEWDNGKHYRWSEVVFDLKGLYYDVSRKRGFERQGLPTYEQWIDLFDTMTDQERRSAGRKIALLDYKPLISVIMPVYNTDESMLRKALDSVTTQLYTYWELCIADDASTRPHVRKILEEYARKDERIRVVFREKNGHIASASNSALEIAKGDFIALMDHDDELAEKALLRIAEELDRHPDADIIYSDEDKIDLEGRRSEPHFKSDWNPELFFSQNYISHLTVYRAGLVMLAGVFREGFEGSQDYDLTLRCINKTDGPKIRHIPEILYHWRTVPGSAAGDEDAKDYAYTAGVKALEDFFAGERGVTVNRGPWPGTYRVNYPPPGARPLVSLIIPTHNGCGLLRKCIESITEKTTYENFEVIVVDNRSDDPETLQYFDKMREDPRIRLISFDKPFNFSAINNHAVRSANGEILGLVNNDVEVISPEWLQEMVALAVRPGIGAVGAKLLYSDGRLQHAGIIVGLGGVAGHSHKFLPGADPGYFCRTILPQALSAVTGACLVVRKELYLEVGGLDEENLEVAFNDVDFCLKLRKAGYRNVWTPYALLYHHESVSRGHEDTPEKQARFRKEVLFMKDKWGKNLLRDPYYNPNLTLAREDFSLGEAPLNAVELQKEKGKACD